MKNVAWALFLVGAWAGCGTGSPTHDDGPGTDVADASDATLGDLGTDLPGDPGPGDTLPGDTATDASDDGADVAKPLPDAAFFHARRDPPATFPDTAISVDHPVLYRTTEQLPDLDVRALASTPGTVWAGTASGLYSLGGAAAFLPVSLGADGPVADLSVSPGSTLWVALPDRVVPVDGTGVAGAPILAGIVPTAVASDDDTLWVGTATGLWTADLTSEDKPVLAAIGAAGDVPVRDLLVTGTGAIVDLWVATDRGVLKVNGGQVTATLDAAGGFLLDDDVRALAWDDGSNVLWAATASGLASWSGFTGLADRKVAAGKGALPSDDLVAVSAADGQVAVGHARGGSVTSDRVPYEHYVSQRWLPDDNVTAVVLDDQGTAWFGTRAGIANIRRTESTLRAKADAFFDQMMARYWRLDFIGSDAYSDDEWNPTTWSVPDFDNDGLWTQMGIGALCYAYAVTKDEKYYQAARRAMDMMFLQVDVPAVSFEKAGLGRGFITRSLVRDDEPELFLLKSTDPRWHLVDYTDGHQYYWKDDTSSDELAGHFFGFPLFYDLCAKDDAERAAVAEHAGAVARYIVKGGYTLPDLDGEPTSFGHWEPSEVAIAVDGLEACADAGYGIDDCVEAAYGFAWLNGTEGLGLLLSAWHMTGDPDLYRAYDDLVVKHRYADAIRFHDEIVTVAKPSMANHSDHELAMLAYHTLIRYEPDDARRADWIDSLKGFYGWESGGKPGAGDERHPLWAAFVSLADPAAAKAADGVRSLREYPADLRQWPVDNSHRKDAGNWPKDRFGDPQFDTVFPYDEIKTIWWNTNPYKKVGDGHGRASQGPVAYLLAYWANVYAGIVVEPAPDR